ncbi:GGDEF domain-containing protein [Saccharobesus litoralis]|uniref:diguanylate cyclase n=1 Tax=Saccharobesus litoralis TaxID=2172099 RepID=A0A2S0VNC7_9ALTE|nr:GGDEF domain-containing protein [Saccharobesus litoralis]AWB65731.1 GGDEF domain-containing protein [Saccharobesus litoralis]
MSYYYHEQIIQLTAQIDAEGLHDTFVQLVKGLFPDAEIRLYNNRLPASHGHYELLHLSPTLSQDELKSQVSQDTQLLDALIKEHASIEFDLSQDQIVYPLMARNLYFGALIIDGHAIEDLDKQTVLAAYIAIYSNQLNLLRTSNHDALTGLFNRQTFDGTLNKLLSTTEHRRNQDGSEEPHRHCFAMLDIDHFKRLNDNFGHLIGDEVLLTLAQLMQKCFRDEDMLFRYGGEEFVIIIKRVDLAMAGSVLERFRQLVENHYFPQVGRVTISIGYTQLVDNVLPTTIIGRADKALYHSKELGRNKASCYETLIEQNKLDEAPGASNDIELF